MTQLKLDLYHARPETWNFERAKTARIDDRKLVHVSNIEKITIVDPSEFSRSSKSKFQAVRDILKLFDFLLLLICVSCGLKSTHNVHDLAATKQRQKIVFLQKKIQLAEKEYQKIGAHIEQLSEEMYEVQFAYVRKKIDEYEDLLRKDPKKRMTIDLAERFEKECEILYEMIRGKGPVFEAQILLEKILQLIDG